MLPFTIIIKKEQVIILSKKYFNFYVTFYFKICNYKKESMWIKRHIFSLYTHILKFVTIKRKYHRKYFNKLSELC